MEGGWAKLTGSLLSRGIVWLAENEYLCKTNPEGWCNICANRQNNGRIYAVTHNIEAI